MNGPTRAMIAAGVVFVAGGLACGGGDANAPPPSGRKTVLVVNNAFQPTSVSISVGDTVLWSWAQGSADHNVISTGSTSFASKGTAVMPGTGTDGTDFFDAPMSHQVIFNAAGTYAYYCSIHGSAGAGMSGSVVVSP